MPDQIFRRRLFGITISRMNWEKKFLKFVDKRINNLCVTPGIGSIRYDEVRCTMIKGFPYIIYYTIKKSSKQVIILSVLHAFRKPIW